MAKANIEILKDPSDTAWTAFLTSNPAASIFHHPLWSQLLVECYGYRSFALVLRKPDGTVTAGVPFMEINSPLTGRRWASLPFSDHCQPLYSDSCILQEITDGILEKRLDQNIPTLDLRGQYFESPVLQQHSQHVIHEVALEAEPGRVFGRVHEMHRRNIKIARTSDIQIVRGETEKHLSEFYNLHVETRRRQGVPVQPWRFFKIINDKLISRGMGFVLLAYKNRQCIAGAVFLHWQKTLTYKYGASTIQGLQYRPNNLLMWNAMEWGCLNGFTSFDMGRTSLSNTGLRTFKSRWGAKESPLFYTAVASLNEHVGESKLMGLITKVVQQSPLWVCRLTGELLYKHFG